MNTMISSVYAYLKQTWNVEKLIKLDVRNVKIQDACINYDFVNTIEIEPAIAKCEKLAIFKPERAEKVKKLSRLPIQKVKQSLIIPDEKGEPLTVDEMVQILDFTRFEAGRYQDTKLTDILTACGVDGIFAKTSKDGYAVPLAPRNFEKNETVPIFYDFTLESEIGIEPDIETCDCDKQPKSRFKSRRPKVQKHKRYVKESFKVKDSMTYEYVDDVDDVDDIVDITDEAEYAIPPKPIDVVVEVKPATDTFIKDIDDRVVLPSHPNYDILMHKFGELCIRYSWGDDLDSLKKTATNCHLDLDEFFRLLNVEDNVSSIDEDLSGDDENVPAIFIERLRNVNWNDYVAPRERVELNIDHPNYNLLMDKFPHLTIGYTWNEDDETLKNSAIQHNENLDEFFRLLTTTNS